ncbi:hypothetical protein ACFY5D_16650 [Paeniglutamicibacter sp. NPDC012692]|uniref:hypothetical protein n=1 Tax=Paeniglutamicibacter sp. NPDC012692 TaxID=3364388 RepID=UPI00368C2221
MLDKFGPQLRADLQQVYGVDLAVLFKARRYVHLLALIDGLPAHSRYMEAYLNDEEIATAILDSGQSEASGDYHPPLSSWTPELAMLTEIKDTLAASIATQVGVAGGKAKNPKPSPRPVTAIDRIKEQRSREAQQQIVDLFGGKRHSN